MTEWMQNPVPPGWYEPSQQPGLLRYWNGQGWDETVPPQPAVPAAVMAQRMNPAGGYVPSGLRTVGWLCAFFFPIAGFVIGCMCIAKGPEKDGWAMTLVSAGTAVFGFLILLNAASQPY